MKPPQRIALLGAESTGKTTLARDLAARLRAGGLRVAVVDEVLREWCDQRGRTPRADEQPGIAREQARRIEAARGDIVIADTSALMIAVYSHHVFGDTALYDEALARQRDFSHTLLMGLDLPWVPDGLQREGPQVREPVDALLRAALARGGIAYRGVYGSGAARVRAALDAIGRLQPDDGQAGRAAAAAPDGGDPGRWVWVCDKCSDPDCEHRLFTALMRSPAAGRSPG